MKTEDQNVFRACRATDYVGLVCEAYSKVFGIEKSRSEVRRLIQQGSVQIDGEKKTDPNSKPILLEGDVLRLDKKHAVRLKV